MFHACIILRTFSKVSFSSVAVSYYSVQEFSPIQLFGFTSMFSVSYALSLQDTNGRKTCSCVSKPLTIEVVPLIAAVPAPLLRCWSAHLARQFVASSSFFLKKEEKRTALLGAISSTARLSSTSFCRMPIVAIRLHTSLMLSAERIYINRVSTRIWSSFGI